MRIYHKEMTGGTIVKINMQELENSNYDIDEFLNEDTREEFLQKFINDLLEHNIIEFNENVMDFHIQSSHNGVEICMIFPPKTIHFLTEEEIQQRKMEQNNENIKEKRVLTPEEFRNKLMDIMSNIVQGNNQQEYNTENIEDKKIDVLCRINIKDIDEAIDICQAIKIHNIEVLNSCLYENEKIRDDKYVLYISIHNSDFYNLTSLLSEYKSKKDISFIQDNGNSVYNEHSKPIVKDAVTNLAKVNEAEEKINDENLEFDDI